MLLKRVKCLVQVSDNACGFLHGGASLAYSSDTSTPLPQCFNPLYKSKTSNVKGSFVFGVKLYNWHSHR